MITPPRIPGIAIALVVALAGTARAQPRGDKARRAEAKAHFAQAQAHFAAKTYDAAAAEYQAAYDLIPEPGLLFNIGLCRENLGQDEAAIELYQRYLELAGDSAKAGEARARLHVLEERLAERRRQAAERAARPPPPPIVARPAPGPEAPPPSLIPGAVVLGGAAVATVVGVVYQRRAGALRDERDAELANGTPPLDSRDPRFDEGRDAALAASIGWAVAGVAAITGTALTARALLARR